MREDPPLITVGDPVTGRVTAQITLVVPDAAQLPWDDSGSRGEGLVLLSGGRLLVAKEKDPPAVIMFAPSITRRLPSGHWPARRRNCWRTSAGWPSARTDHSGC